MQIFTTDTFPIPLPDGHFFPLEKYRRLRERVESLNLPSGETGRCEVAPAATKEQLLRAHTPGYVERFQSGQTTDLEQRRLGFPWSPELVERSRRSCGATVAACRAALQDGIAAYLGGGTHHAFADFGQGYCVFNDSVVAARTMQAEHRIERAVILDCDVHQGNGTAHILRDDPTVFTFSIHGASNYPKFKEASDLDIALPDGTGDVIYLAELEDGVRQALDAADADLAIYLAGADPHQGDRIGKMELTHRGLRARDALILEACRSRDLPVAITIAGGYGRDVNDVVEVHTGTMLTAAALLTDRDSANPLA